MGTTLNSNLRKPESEQDAQKVATYNEAVDGLNALMTGMLSLSVAGSANVTLTQSQAVNRAIKFTGALTGNITVYLPVIANAALSPPTTTVGSARDILIWNATTGAFTLTIKTSAVGSAGVAITQTKKVYVAHDNVDVFKTTTEV